MASYVYMLECSDLSIYVGHTDDLEVRLAKHRNRTNCGYTAKRLPVKLIYSESFATREDALAAERKIKGWTRAKKLAFSQLGRGHLTRTRCTITPWSEATNRSR
jgi:predicted GIY-YIG superfamily endonuclease